MMPCISYYVHETTGNYMLKMSIDVVDSKVLSPLEVHVVDTHFHRELQYRDGRTVQERQLGSMSPVLPARLAVPVAAGASVHTRAAAAVPVHTRVAVTAVLAVTAEGNAMRQWLC